MTNDNRTTEYFKKLGAMRLSEAARERITDNLSNYIAFHAVDQDVRMVDESRLTQQVPHGTSLLIRIFTIRIPTMAAFLILALLVGGGTSYAAQGSLPGEILYPVKVNVNENVETALALTPQAEAKTQASLVTTRLNEAATLAAEGKLNASTSAQLNNNLQRHYEAAQKASDKAAANGNLAAAAEAHATLAGSLNTYATVLDNLNTQVHGNEGQTFVAKLNAYADALDQASTTVHADASAGAHVNAVIKQTSGTLTEVEAKLNHAKPNLSSDTYASLKAQLDTAHTAETEAQTHFSAQEYQQAFDAAQSALVTAKQAEATVNSSLRLKATVNAHVHEQTQTTGEASSEQNTNNASTSENGQVNMHAELPIELHASGSVKAGSDQGSSASDSGASVETQTNLNADNNNASATTELHGNLNL